MAGTTTTTTPSREESMTEHEHRHEVHRHGAGSVPSTDDHEHDHGGGWWPRIRHLITPHSHDSADKVDSALEASRDGMRALWISLAVLCATAALQASIVAFSGSVALLGDTLHNMADALTAVPLGIAFMLGRRAATRAYTYGFGRAEDLAGVVIVLVIAGSSLAAAWFALERLMNPQQMTHLPWVFAAGLIGFAGNEIVARYRITVGRRIGSAALVADGLHARTDGFTSLAVVAGAAGVAAGWSAADPVVGLVITVAILAVLRTAARDICRRLMDAVDPALVDAAETALAAEPGVLAVRTVRMRWIGHRLHAEADLTIDPATSLASAHRLAHDAEHALTHAVPKLATTLVHAYPADQEH